MTFSNRATNRKQSKRDLAKETIWRAHIEAWKKSGLSQPEFCLLNNLNKHTFQYWITHIARRDAADERAASGVKKTDERARRSSAKPKRKPVEFVPIDVVQEEQEWAAGENIQAVEQKTFAFEIQTLKGLNLRISVDTDSLQMVLAAMGLTSC